MHSFSKPIISPPLLKEKKIKRKIASQHSTIGQRSEKISEGEREAIERRCDGAEGENQEKAEHPLPLEKLQAQLRFWDQDQYLSHCKFIFLYIFCLFISFFGQENFRPSLSLNGFNVNCVSEHQRTSILFLNIDWERASNLGILLKNI